MAFVAHPIGWEMKSASFSYLLPRSTEEALKALSESGDEARVIAGGQSLVPMMNMRIVTPAKLIDINEIESLAKIEYGKHSVRIGAVVRQSSALDDANLAKLVPLLPKALHHVGHFQTRNRGTLCGSTAHADPSAEIPLVLLVSLGEVELRSKRAKRLVAADKFFRSALTTDRRPEELVTAIVFPVLTGRCGCAFSEFSLREGDFAIVAAACSIQVDDNGRIEKIVLGFSGVTDRPILCPTNELVGMTTAEANARFGEYAATAPSRVPNPPSDLHATGSFRKQLVKVLGLEVLTRALSEAIAGGETRA